MHDAHIGNLRRPRRLATELILAGRAHREPLFSQRDRRSEPSAQLRRGRENGLRVHPSPLLSTAQRRRVGVDGSVGQHHTRLPKHVHTACVSHESKILPHRRDREIHSIWRDRHRTAKASANLRPRRGERAARAPGQSPVARCARFKQINAPGDLGGAIRSHRRHPDSTRTVARQGNAAAEMIAHPGCAERRLSKGCDGSVGLHSEFHDRNRARFGTVVAIGWRGDCDAIAAGRDRLAESKHLPRRWTNQQARLDHRRTRRRYGRVSSPQ